MTTAKVSSIHADFRMQEWGMGEQSRRIQRSVRRVLIELSTESLLRLKDPRLQVLVSPTTIYDTWAYFPMHSKNHFSGPQECRLIMEPLALPETRVLLLLGTNFTRKAMLAATVVLPPDTTTSPSDFEDYLRHQLGHVLLYLRSPKARNNCPDALREWTRAARPCSDCRKERTNNGRLSTR
jgi:hypothetical protein